MTSQRSQLVNDLLQLTVDLGRAPTPEDIDEESAYGITDYRDEFGSWANALAAADIDKPTNVQIPDDVLLAELRRLTKELGKTPSQLDMTDHGQHGSETYTRRFGSWNGAVEAAGLDPNPDRQKRSREELLADLRDAADDLGRSPTRREMEDYTEADVITFRNRFGSWNEALEAAGLELRPAQERVPDDELLAELQRLEKELGTPPTTTDIEDKGEFSQGVYYKRFDTWSAALEAAGCGPS